MMIKESGLGLVNMSGKPWSGRKSDSRVLNLLTHSASIVNFGTAAIIIANTDERQVDIRYSLSPRPRFTTHIDQTKTALLASRLIRSCPCACWRRTARLGQKLLVDIDRAELFWRR
jgi:hypothetical protein